MKKGLLLFFAVVLCGLQAVAQDFSVTGRVTYADDGSPVIGATVLVKGMTSIGSITDVHGAYKITIPASATEKALICRFIGMEDQERMVVSNGQVVDFSMVVDAKNIETVIVTGYGSVTKKEYTGSAATVSTERTKDVPTISIESRLAGAIPGVNVTSASGAPGSMSSVRIRGMGSMNAGNEPLYVIDGVPVFSGDMNTLKVTRDNNDNGNSALATLNPNDIQSVTVIKDAAAASLYGSRAANGVIVITTKKGSAGKLRINVKADLGFSDMAIDYRPTLDGDARREVLKLGLYNYAHYIEGKSEALAQDFAKVKIDEYAQKPWNGEWTNWRKELFRTGVNQNYELSASGGNEKTRFYSSLSYSDVQGITMQAEYKRITGRLNVDHKSNNFTLNANTMISTIDQSYNEEETGFSNPLYLTVLAAGPQDYTYNPDGTFNLTKGFANTKGGRSNPVFNNTINTNTSKSFRSMSNLSAQYEFFEGLTAKQVVSFDYTQSNNVVWWDPRSNNGLSWGGVNQTIEQNFMTLVAQTQLAYNNVFNGHSISALASFETEQNTDRNIYAMGSVYANPNYPNIDNGSEKDASGNNQTETMLSWVARADYNYESRYYVGASFRRDGTSRLSPESRWGNFWSVSGSWRMSNENWWREGGIGNVLTEAKIRASYGVNGTRPNNWYDYMGIFALGYNYNGAPGMTETRIPNSNLRWEQNYATNIGLDLTFIDRINLSVDLYDRDTKDLLMSKPISQTTGFSTSLQNVGSMNNKGIEVDFNAIAVQTQDIQWNVGFNLGHNQNKLTKLDGLQDQIVDSRWIHRVGESYYSYYLVSWAGVDPETGAGLYYIDPENGNYNKTSDASKAKKSIVGTWDPVVQGGVNSAFSWKFIDFNFMFTFSLGGQTLNNMGTSSYDGNYMTYHGQLPVAMDIDKMWKKPGDVAELPMFYYKNAGVYTSDRFLMSTDHLRLKNLTIGFTTPKAWMGNSGLEGVRLYVAGNNLFTIKDPKLVVDPETIVGGVSYIRTPQLRTITVGLELKF